MTKITIGSYVIPMNAALQPSTDSTTINPTNFNYKAYGLVVNLLWGNCPVMWAISSTKTAPGGADFSAAAFQKYPTTQSASFYNYRYGPFVVDVSYITGVLSVSPTVDSIISSFANSVVVHQLTADTNVDVRYTLMFKPKVGVLDSTAYFNIHRNTMLAAGITEGRHFANLTFTDSQNVGPSSCYTMLAEPHWDSVSYTNAVNFNDAMKSFLVSGGNFIGQCAGIAVYEQCYIRNTASTQRYIMQTADKATALASGTTATNSQPKCNSLFITDGGFYVPMRADPWASGSDNAATFSGSSAGPFKNTNWLSAFSQWETWKYDGGYIDAMTLKRSDLDQVTSWFRNFTTGGVTTQLAYFGARQDSSSRGTNGISLTAHGKLRSYYDRFGANIFYLTGHDYTKAGHTTGLTYGEGGLRSFLNAMLYPSIRPASCGFNIPATDACAVFDPYAHSDQIFTPGCIEHITLDNNVGDSVKDCTSTTSLALPVGWEVVTMTPSEMQNVRSYGGSWVENCMAGAAVGSLVENSAIAKTPTNVSCSVGPIKATISNTLGTKCYNVTGCGGNSLVIRHPVHVDTCNAFNYGVYCSPSPMGAANVYNSSLATNPNNIYISLSAGGLSTPGPTLPVNYYVPLLQQASVMVLIDTYNVDTTKLGDVKSMHKMLPYIWDTYLSDTKIPAIVAGWGTVAAASPWSALGQSLTPDRFTLLSSTAPSVPTLTGAGGLSPNVAKALSNVIASTTYASMSYRQIWVVTKSVPPPATDASVVALKTALNSATAGQGIVVVIGCASSTAKSGWDALIATDSTAFARFTTTLITWTNFATSDTATTWLAGASRWVPAMITSSWSNVGKLTIVDQSDLLSFSTPPSTTTIPNFGRASGVPYQQYFTSNAASYQLPAGYGVQGGLSAPMPQIVQLRVVETGWLINAYVSWNVAPVIPAKFVPMMYYLYTDDTTKFPQPFYVPILEKLRFYSDANGNNLNITYRSSTFTNSYPAAGWAIPPIKNAKGSVDGTTMLLGVSYNALGLYIQPDNPAYGNLTLTYDLYDGCLYSGLGTVVIEYKMRNVPPMASPIYLTGPAGTGINFNLAAYISDYETPTPNLQISILTDLTSTFGTMYTGQSSYTTFPINTPSTLYQFLRFVALNTDVNTVQRYTYRVYDAGGAYAESFIQITQTRVNNPPHISISPATVANPLLSQVVTTPTQTGSWTVTIRDSTWDSVTLYINSTTLNMPYITLLKSTNPTKNIVPITIGTLFSGPYVLSVTPVNGQVDIPMQWIPAANHPYGITHTITFSAVDAGGLWAPEPSVTVQLTIPPNQNPTCPATAGSYSQPQNSAGFTISITGSDPNAQDANKLSYTLTVAPSQGTLYFPASGGTAVTVGTELTVPTSTTTTSTTYTFTYIPSSLAASSTSIVSDSFSGVFGDVGLDSSSCPVGITLTVVPKPPRTFDVNYNAQQNVPINVVITGTDPENNIVRLEIMGTNLRAGSVVTKASVPLSTSTPYAGTTTWTFVYTTSIYVAGTDTFTYRVVDSTGLISPVQTATITTQVTAQPPLVRGKTVSTPEDTPLTIPLSFAGNGNTLASVPSASYADVDTTFTSTSLTLKSVPSSLVGTLTAVGSSTPLKVGDVIPVVSGVPQVIFYPSLNWNGQTSFDFQASDGSSTSGIATVIINVTPVDDPPHIYLSPVSVQQDRGTTGLFTVTVTDVDSPTVAVLIKNDLINYVYSSFTVTGAGHTTPKYVDGTTIRTLTAGAGQVFPTFTLSWTPSFTAPDSLTGSFQLYATASGATSTEQPVGTVSVKPNVAPYGTTTTPISVLQNAAPLPLFLKGTDINPWDTTNLIVTLVAVGPGLTVTNTAGTVSPGTVLTSSADGTVGTTSGQVSINFANNFFTTAGNPSYITYRVTDTLGLTGDVTIPVSVGFVNQAPSCTNVSITIPESFGSLPTSCWPPTSADYSTCLSSITTITATDTDNSNLQLAFQSITSAKGVVFQRPGVGQALVQVAAGSLLTASKTWYFFYDPVMYAHSSSCTDSTPSGPAPTWTGCATYDSVPFSVTDGALASGTCYLNVVVLPVNNPPSCPASPVQFRLVGPGSGQPALTQDYVIDATDVDGTADLDTISFTSIVVQWGASHKYKATGATVTTGVSYLPDTTQPASLPANTKRWTFTYVLPYNSGASANYDDTITYTLTDKSHPIGSTSCGGTFTITPTPNTPPTTHGASMTTQEDTDLAIPFSFVNSVVPNFPSYYDAETLQPALPIIIAVLPRHGTLLYNGVPVTQGQVIPGSAAMSLTYRPDSNYNGPDSFYFSTNDGQVSSGSPSQVTITITAVNDPPTITLTPISVTVDRQQTGVFTVSVSDIDSRDVTVSVFQASSFPFATAAVEVAGNTVASFTNNAVIKSLRKVSGVFPTFTITWTPSETTPDGTTGSYSLYARDAQSTSNTVEGTVAVNPNHAPTALPQTVPASENQPPTPVILVGTDPEPYHTTVLTGTVDTISPGITLWNGTTPILPGTVLYGTPGTGTTTFNITVKVDPNFSGPANFTYHTTDLLGEPSPPAVVDIPVAHVNQKPVTSNVTITVLGDSCFSAPCTYNIALSKNIVASDPDDYDVGQLQLVFDTPNSSPATRGSLLQDTGSGITAISVPLTLNQASSPDTWNVLYEPVSGSYSVDGGLYIAIPFQAKDLAGSLSDVSYVNVYVTPVSHPPTVDPFTGTAVQSTPLPIPVTGADSDGNFVKLYIDGVYLQNPSTTTLRGPDGLPVVPGNVYTISPAAVASFLFTYNNNGFTSVTGDFFTYHGVDSTLLISPSKNATITMSATPQPPSVTNGTVTTREDTPVPVPLTFGENFTDPDSPACSVMLVITSLPSSGVLMGPDGPLSIGDQLRCDSTSIVYQPGPNFNGITNITYQVKDDTNLVSPNGTITLTVTPVDDAPTILIAPDTLVVNRTETGTFVVTVNDIDSSVVDVLVTGFSLPLDVGSVVTVTVEGVTTTYPVTAASPTLGSIFAVLHYDTAPLGTDLTFTISWTPSAILPDSSVGSVTLRARSNDSAVPHLSINSVTGSVSTVPNNPPVVVPSSNYTVNETQDSWPNKTITLVGTDPDPWHAQNLTVTISCIPSEGVQLFFPNGTMITGPVTLPSEPGNGITAADIVVKPIPGWSGDTSFCFTIKDPLGSVSPPTVVNITVNHVNHPPTSRNYTLILPENYAVFGVADTELDFLYKSTLEHFDVDPQDTMWWLQFVAPPDVVPGKAGFRQASTFSQLTSVGPYDSATPWDVWYQPAQNAHSSGCLRPETLFSDGCFPYTVMYFRVYDSDPTDTVIDNGPGVPSTIIPANVTGHASQIYSLTVYVVPVNQAPTSQDLVYHINEDETLTVYYKDGDYVYQKIPASDVDNIDAEIGATLLDVLPSSVGTWKYMNGTAIGMENPPPAGFDLPSRALKYTPPPNAYSLTKPLSVLDFQVYDPEGLTSLPHSIKVYVDPVPDMPVYVGGNASGPEDTQFRLPLDGASSVDAGTPVFVITQKGLGNFTICNQTACSPVGSLPTVIPPGASLFYKPPLDQNGVNYSYFTFNLTYVDSLRPDATVKTLVVNYTITVTPVDDPPVLVLNCSNVWFDEDTFLRVNISATDIDSPLSALRLETLTVMRRQECSLFNCIGTVSDDCTYRTGSHRNTALSVGPVTKWADARWIVSYKSYPNWNGKVVVTFVAYDEFGLKSDAVSCPVRILPINDLPSLVEGSTSCHGEYYTTNPNATVGKRVTADPGYELVEKRNKWTYPSSSWETEEFKLVPGATPDKTEVHIYARIAVTSDRPKGEVLEEFKGDYHPPKKTQSKNEKVVRVNRIKFELIDVDFYFDWPLMMNVSLIHATFVPGLMTGSSPCVMLDTVNARMQCSQEITVLNVFTGQYGFPVVIDDNADSALFIILVNDTGNLDKWNRPLAGGFTIEIIKPTEDEPLVVPIAAIAILPIIAALTAASIAAAWILLGQRANEYAGAAFDAFAVANHTGGNVNVLYDAKDLEVESALYDKGSA